MYTQIYVCILYNVFNVLNKGTTICVPDSRFIILAVYITRCSYCITVKDSLFIGKQGMPYFIYFFFVNLLVELTQLSYFN